MTLSRLDKLESKSIYILREAYKQYKNTCMLWSIGKDSTTMLWLARKAFYGRIPFPVMQIDTSFEFDEVYDFRDKYAKKWGFELIIERNEKALNDGVDYDKVGGMQGSHLLKTVPLQNAIKKHGFDALFVGIRRDEHGIRAKERVFSPRDEDFQWDYKNQPMEVWDQYKNKKKRHEHIRVHPLLHWTELDIWEYIKRENMPVNELYFAKNGKRYRSLGARQITHPVESNADTIDGIIKELKTTKTSERSGRSQDKEDAYTMQKLRSLGYM